MIETKEIVNILSEEMSEFEGKVIFSDMYKDNNVQLDEIETEDNTVYLYCSYKRKYCMLEVKKKSGAVAGWRKKVKNNKRVPVNIRLTVPEETDPNGISVLIEGSYNGNSITASLIIDEEGVTYSNPYEPEAFDSMEEKDYTSNPYVSNEVPGKTISRAIEKIVETVKVRLEKAMDNVEK